MASWTDNPAQFNPYVQQLPVEAMVAVGTEKQRRYDEGVQRIQSSVDRIAGLDIARDVDKQYLQNKLTDLGDKLKFVAAGDFSDYQLVNAVTGMTSKVGKDENIQNAVISTARYRNEVQRMETDREEGILDPSNEFFFNKQADQWFNNPNVGTSFKGKYIPHFDVFGFAKETFDSVKPDEMSFDQIFELDENGKPVKDENGNLIYSTYMTRLEEKGIFPQKVKETLAQIFSDPRVSQQLNISGQYEYRGLDEQALGIMLDGQRVNILAGYDEEINRQLLEKGVAKTTEEKEEIQRNIDKLKSQKSQTNQSYISYIQQAKDNPDGVRSYLYKNEVENRYTTMFGHTETSRQIMNNPAHKAVFEMQKEANRNTQFYQRLKFDMQKHADDMTMKQKEFDAKNTPEMPLNEWFTAKQTSDIDRIKYANDRMNAAQNSYRSATDDFIWEMIFSNDETGQYRDRLKALKLGQGIDEYSAMGIILAEEAQKAGKSVDKYKTDKLTQAMMKYENMSPDNKNQSYIASRKYENYHQAKRNLETEKNNRAMIDAVLAEDNIRIGQEFNVLNVQPQTVRLDNGEQVNLTTEDIYDLAIYATAIADLLIGKTKEQRDRIKQDANDAIGRLKERGKEDVLSYFRKDNPTGASKVGRFTGKVVDVAGMMINPDKLINEFGKQDDNWSQVFNVVDILNSPEHRELLKKQGEVIQRIYSITPKQSKPLLTGKAEINRDIVMKVASFAGAWQQGGADNTSPDFKKFSVDVSSPEKNNFSVEASRTGDETKIEIVQFDDENNRVAGMAITSEQARLLGIYPDRLFESPEVVNLRNAITVGGNQTSKGDPESISTYTNGTVDYYFKKHDFPKLVNSPEYDVKANIRQDGGIFYPFVYISDGNRAQVIEMQGKDHLQDVVTTLKNELSPSFINQYLDERYARESNK